MDNHARIILIFKGDKDLHKAAKAVSDSFEHGYENFPALYQPAGRALVKTAACLREEIIRVTGVDAATRAKILDDRYVRPKGKSALDTYLRGTLTGEADDPAAPGTTYPYLDWESKVTNVSFDQKTQKYSFQPNMQFKASLATGVALTDIRFETWDGSFFMPDEKWSGAV
jgi:hypothetical protein